MDASLKGLDRAVMDLCTRLCHRVQRRAGITNYFIVRCVGLFICAISVMDYMHHHWIQQRALDFTELSGRFNDAVMMTYSFYVFVLLPGRLDSQFQRDPTAVPSWPLSWMTPSHPVMWRPVLLVLNLVWVSLMVIEGDPFWQTFRNSGFLLIIVALYLMAVTPLPPAAAGEVSSRSREPFAARALNAGPSREA